jgi:hypothetical protein
MYYTGKGELVMSIDDLEMMLKDIKVNYEQNERKGQIIVRKEGGVITIEQPSVYAECNGTNFTWNVRKKM